MPPLVLTLGSAVFHGIHHLPVSYPPRRGRVSGKGGHRLHMLGSLFQEWGEGHRLSKVLRMQRRGRSWWKTVLGRRKVFRPGHGASCLSFLLGKHKADGLSFCQQVWGLWRLQHAFTHSRYAIEASYLLSKSLCMSSIFISNKGYLPEAWN